MVEPLLEPDREIDPIEPVPDDPAELLPDAPEPLPPAPIEATPDDSEATGAACPSLPEPRNSGWRLAAPERHPG